MGGMNLDLTTLRNSLFLHVEKMKKINEIVDGVMNTPKHLFDKKELGVFIHDVVELFQQIPDVDGQYDRQVHQHVRTPREETESGLKRTTKVSSAVNWRAQDQHRYHRD